MQGKSLVSFRDETEESAKIRKETLSLQKQAAARIRKVGAFPFADKIAWVFLTVYLIVRYRIRESGFAGGDLQSSATQRPNFVPAPLIHT